MPYLLIKKSECFFRHAKFSSLHQQDLQKKKLLFWEHICILRNTDVFRFSKFCVSKLVGFSFCWQMHGGGVCVCVSVWTKLHDALLPHWISWCTYMSHTLIYIHCKFHRAVAHVVVCLWEIWVVESCKLSLV